MKLLKLTLLAAVVTFSNLTSLSYETMDTVRVADSETVGPVVSRPLTIKSNVVGWGMLMVNVAAEYEFSQRWSVEVPVYYSCWNYFSHDTKFRNLIIQPEVKYYFDRDEHFCVGAHIGVGYYNWSFGGDYRYQTHHKRDPLGGGGVSLSYRTRFGRDSRWGLELSLGFGAYLNEYDRYKNTACDCDPNDLSHYDENGKCPCRTPDFFKKAFVGIDKFNISFTYTFDIKKR